MQGECRQDPIDRGAGELQGAAELNGGQRTRAGCQGLDEGEGFRQGPIHGSHRVSKYGHRVRIVFLRAMFLAPPWFHCQGETEAAAPGVPPRVRQAASPLPAARIDSQPDQ